MGIISWKSELSLFDEFLGREPRYPLATEIEYQAYEFHKQNQILNKLSINQKKELTNTTNRICGSLENGFTELHKINTEGFSIINSSIQKNTEILNESLISIDRSLEQIEGTLNWGFSEILSQLLITNNKLDEIIKLLNIPDSQKQRKYHIEQGLNFIKKSYFNKVFYQNSLENFEKALKIERSDYLTLQQLGVIHLYSQEHIDLNLSEEYFNESILYSSSEIDFLENKENKSSFEYVSNPELFTVKTQKHLARCFYIQKKIQLSYETLKESISNIELSGNLIDLSKTCIKLNLKDEAIYYLNKALDLDKYISIKILNDKTFISENYILKYLNELSINKYQQAKSEYEQCLPLLRNNSRYTNLINEVKFLLKKQTYINSQKALEILK